MVTVITPSIVMMIIRKMIRHEKKHAHQDSHKDHGQDKEKHGHDDHKKDAHGHQGHDHGAFDPHAWQDLKNAVIYVDNITAALAKADPVNAAAFMETGKLTSGDRGT